MNEDNSFQVALVVKNPLANAGDAGDSGSVPASGRSPGRGNGNPLQYSCLENPMEEEPGWLQAIDCRESDRNAVTKHAHY